MTTLFDLTISAGSSITSKTVKPETLGFQHFKKHVVIERPDDPTETKNGRYFCPGLMDGRERGTDHVQQCNVLAIDIDHMTVSQCDQMDYLLSESGLEYIKYTTWNHTTEAPRYRLIFRPSRSLDVPDYKWVVLQLMDALAIANADNCSFRPAQGMFYPYCYEDNEDQAFIEYHEGGPVETEPYLLRMSNPAFLAKHYAAHGGTLEPLPIPGGLDAELWYSCILDSYPAADLTNVSTRYDDWTEVGMALYHQTDGQGDKLWLEWSRKDNPLHGVTITEGEMMDIKWPSFRLEGIFKGVTIRKILNHKNKTRHSVLARAYTRYIELVSDRLDFNRLIGDIQNEKFLHGDDHKSMAPSVVKGALTCLNEKIDRGTAMRMIKPEFKVLDQNDYFYDMYLFSEAEGQYYDVESKEPVSLVSMNYIYGETMPTTNAGEFKQVHKVLTTAANGYTKPRVMHGKVYKVGAGPVVTEGKRCYLNEFDPESWPRVGAPFDPDDAIDTHVRDMVGMHLGLLCNKDEELVTLILQHLAHLRQRPTVRMHFAYAISSAFGGAGKSTLRELYKAVLGDAQVNLLSASNIAEDYNNYAAMPKLMSFIEEFEFPTRREQNTAIKKMKDLITSDTVSLRRMRTDAYVAQTHTAYAMFSNDEYVLGHEASGRRWVPIIVQAVNAEQCSENLGMDHGEFYTAYYKVLNNYPERIAAYFESISLEGFNKEQPPMTQQKLQFIENNPVVRCSRLITELIEDNITIDLTKDYASGQSTVRLVQDQIDTGVNVDADELRGYNPHSLRTLVISALRSMGYHQSGSQNERFRLPFELVDRTRLSDIYVRDIGNYSGYSGAEKLRNRIRRLKKDRAEAGTAPAKVDNKTDKVVKIDDGTQYDEDDIASL